MPKTAIAVGATLAVALGALAQNVPGTGEPRPYNVIFSASGFWLCDRESAQKKMLTGGSAEAQQIFISFLQTGGPSGTQNPYH